MKVPFLEKVGYSLGDASANLVFQLMMMFRPMFYTDVLGIGAGAACALSKRGMAFFPAFRYNHGQHQSRKGECCR